MQKKRNAKISQRKKHKVNKREKRERFKFKFEFNLKYIKAVAVWTMKVAIVCVMAFVFVWFFGQQVSTVGDSMKPALENGDVVLVNRVVYNARKPKRGDVIVFKPKGNESVHYYIKRVIGLPGETVEIKENRIYIDGEVLEEDYQTTLIEDSGYLDEPVVLDEDEYFVLGDDRENSEDSRHAEVGNVKRMYIYGKAWFVISGENIGFVKE